MLVPIPEITPTQMMNHIERENAIDDPMVVPHVASMLAASKHTQHKADILHLSNIVKQT